MSWDFIAVQGPFGGTSEGPAWDGESLLFTHIPESKIYRFNPKTSTTEVFRENTNCANGLMFDESGNLYACEGGGRRVVRYESDSTEVLAESYEGSRFNVPNDLAIDIQGRVWFTDPFYEGAGGPWSEDRSNKELDHDSVYRIDMTDGKSTAVSRVTEDTTRPNGLLFSLDYQTLYVAQSGRLPEEERQLRAYPVNSDGSLGSHEVIHDFGEHRGIDGMVLDADGNIVATAGYKAGGPGPLIYVFSASGEVLETHPTPFDRPTNCSFGGEDLSTLYVTTGDGFLLRAFTERQGRLNFPKI
ncbi:MAG TPA: gluconolactonase [Dehalococcoidia bacterium]|uniref:SMP-30/Gluconolactonase/LRE-like region domain-containing protein n=1 Tax=marine metagenome TaxID=408172 RepID=A0A381WYU6_9ZZZZ|nr:gluconolactonase [Dehalococcoidia bacterium]HBF00552.1 gluconolactonase [Dehalococcoidia bacterium]|tara:strand:- start:8122 stop:9021 length:900 start_codon:yes stop_codon:yes gene_type:complete